MQRFTACKATKCCRGKRNGSNRATLYQRPVCRWLSAVLGRQTTAASSGKKVWSTLGRTQWSIQVGKSLAGMGLAIQ